MNADRTVNRKTSIASQKREYMTKSLFPPFEQHGNEYLASISRNHRTEEPSGSGDINLQQ